MEGVRGVGEVWSGSEAPPRPAVGGFGQNIRANDSILGGLGMSVNNLQEGIHFGDLTKSGQLYPPEG